MKSKKLILISLALILLCLIVALSGCAMKDVVPSGDSQTNVQVQGVDESDVTKTIEQNGVKYIAAIRTDGITISRALDGEITVLKKNPLSGFYDGEMLIHGNVLAFIGCINDGAGSYNNYRTEIRLYDISNLSGAQTGLPLIRTVRLASSVSDIDKRMAARFYDGKIYVMTRPVRGQYYDYDISDSVGGASAEKETLEKQAPRDDSDDYDYYSPNTGAILFSLDLSNPTAQYTAAYYDCIVSDMYLSAEGIFFIADCYILSREATRFLFFRYYARRIYHLSYIFNVDRATLGIENISEPITSPRWSRAIADRYSLHTTPGNLFAVVCDEDNSYSLYSFGLDLKVVGRVSGIAQYETLHGVTYEEGYCYFVTYRNVDPLFKVDISDPENMKIAGELTIPGFSEYLCEFGGYKIGLGYDDSRRNVKISLFDVSYEQPTEINHLLYYYYYDTFSTTPEAMYNPRAILVNFAHNMFGFAMGSKYYIFGVQNGKLAERKTLTNTYEIIKRAVIIDDYLYALSDREIRSYSAADFEFIGKYTLDLSYTQYTITFDSMGGTVIRSQTITAYKYAERPKNPVKYGYTFVGWYYEDSYGNERAFDFYAQINRDYDLYAVWA